MDGDDDIPPKRPRSLNTNLCILCSKHLEHKIYVKNPSISGIKRILECCDLRKDEVYDNIWKYRDEILSSKIKVSFHKDCRAKYTSKSNLKHVSTSSESSVKTSALSASGDSTSRRDGREASSSFEIRNDCFICGKSKWNENVTSISTGTGLSTQVKVLDAARRREDNMVMTRMLAHEDLFAYDAKYHRSCLSMFISERNIQAAINKADGAKKDSSVYEQAFRLIVDYIESTVLSKKKSVNNLSTICVEFNKRLSELDAGSTYNFSSWKLKERLKSHFENRLAFIDQKGRSDIICDYTLAIGEVLKGAALLDSDMDDMEIDDLASNTPQYDEKQLLHTAAGILREKMSNIKQSGEYYLSSYQVKGKYCGEFVPDPLYDFVAWCVNKSAYMNVTSCVDTGVKDNLKIISLCHGFVGECQGVHTPISLGLGIRIHHDFGSKQMINDLYALGYSVSYDEVRRFFTSAAMDQKDLVYIPRGFERPAEDIANTEVEEIDAAIDNFDQNEDTLDGKSTTHSMAAVLYKRSPPLENQQQIPRLNKKSLSTRDIDDSDNVQR